MSSCSPGNISHISPLLKRSTFLSTKLRAWLKVSFLSYPLVFREGTARIITDDYWFKTATKGLGVCFPQVSE